MDLAAIARAMGIAGETVTDPAELGPALERAYASGRPALLDVSIDGAL
ncbi:MAG: thiamine pyrophosphate-dependent enzyme [Chloroflexota bacterium]|nr:thiamine pyrophosphate-dependent enzyme [Chloroflexota bacterium]